VTKEKHQDEEARPSYKATLNLLKTSFGMRANSIQREPELQRFWHEKKIDFDLGLENQGPSFTLHDGPPYANGPLHMGHALNKILKDIINKYQIMNGRKVHFIPGWDCHGLPIELKVLQSLKKDERKELTPLKLRKKAAEYAKKQVEIQKKGFIRWGVWGDWSNPYLTLKKEYEAAQIKIFGEMAIKGFIYRGLKPVHWSPSSRTALAEAELEYPDEHISKSIYFTFPVISIPKALRQEIEKQGLVLPEGEEELSNLLKIAIWTTTPWTIPANLAVSVNDRLDYCIASYSKDKLIVIAKELLDVVSKKISFPLKICAVFKGAIFERAVYRNTLMNRDGEILLGGEYITTESGTGLVHTAPGHGVDDFNTAMKYNLPILCPVNEAGILTSKAGKFEGLNVLKDANESILDALRIENSLLKVEDYNHRYPYDWRTKKPTIFRATEQWFASVTGFRSKALEAIEQVDWVPVSGRNRINSMVSDRGDWCISRQRTWGVPIPVFYEKNGNEVLLNEETISHIYDLILKNGSDIWWKLDVIDLLPPAYSANADKWEKGFDTMDVWFDSGSSWAGVIKQNGLQYPVDLYLEGSDQHRGWFQSSLLTSVAVNNHAPYKKVLTHGFALDEKGRKMSKSLGNVVDPLEIIEGGSNQKKQPPYGADVLRLWVSSVDYSVDVPIGSSILNQLSDTYRKVRNTARYLLGNIHDFNPSIDAIPVDELPLLDKWMLHKTAEFIDQVTESFHNYEFARFVQMLQTFCVVDLSNFYLDIAKDRLYVSSPSERRRRSCQTVMSLIVENLACLIAPVMCHMAEDIWQNIPYQIEEESVFLRGWPKSPVSWKNNSLVKPINELRLLRVSINRVIEGCRNSQEIGASLEAAIRIDIKSPALKNASEMLRNQGDPEVDILRDWLLVSQLQIGGEPWAEVLANHEDENYLIEVARARGRKCDRCWHYFVNNFEDGKIDQLCNRCENVIKN